MMVDGVFRVMSHIRADLSSRVSRCKRSNPFHREGYRQRRKLDELVAQWSRYVDALNIVKIIAQLGGDDNHNQNIA